MDARRLGIVVRAASPASRPPGQPPAPEPPGRPARGASDAATPRLKGKGTRTYTGEALARRQAWGRTWAAYQREIGRQLRQREDA